MTTFSRRSWHPRTRAPPDLVGVAAMYRTSEKQRQQGDIQGVHRREKERNRARVQEIMHLKTHFGEELDALEEDYNHAADQDDDY